MDAKHMTRIEKKRYRRQETGSASVEALISFTAFLFIIFTILNVINYCRVQSLISNALDTAAKELAQYSYFYQMSGLQKFSEDVRQQADFGAGNINGVIQTVDGLYQSTAGAVSQAGSDSRKIVDSITNAQDPSGDVQTTLANLQRSGNNIEGAMSAVEGSFQTIADNPLVYIKSILAVAGNEGLDLLKSHALAAPLAKAFVVKHFGSSRQEADEYLRGLGVVDGLDGMNFKASTVFSSNEPELIHLVVYYQIEIPAVLKWAELRLPVCKEAVTRAWLGGDTVTVRIKPQVENNTWAQEDPGDEQTGNPEETETPQETENPEESEAPRVDLTGSSWTKDQWDQHEDFQALLEKEFLNTSGAELLEEQSQLHGRALGMAYGHTTITEPSRYSSGHMATELMMGTNLLAYQYEKWNETNGQEGWEPGSVHQYTMVVYVPENISDEDYSKLKDEAWEITQYMSDYYKEEAGLKDEDVMITISVHRGGGNYDYDSEGQS